MARPLARLLCAASAGVALASSPIHGDAAALLQVGASIEQQGSDACQCLSWKDAYTKYRVVCGERELYFLKNHSFHKPHFMKDLCSDFFEKMTHNLCANLLHMGESRDQWCYVPPNCLALNGGGVSGISHKWKFCKPEQDTMMHEMTPLQLLKVAQDDDISASNLMLSAYPVYSGKLKYKDVQNCINGTISREPEKCATLAAIQATGKPMVINSEDHVPPIGIVIGSKLFEARLTMNFWINYYKADAAKDKSLALKDLGKAATIECVAGCSV